MNSPPDVCDTKEESPRLWGKSRGRFFLPPKKVPVHQVFFSFYKIFFCTHLIHLVQLDSRVDTSIAMVLKGPKICQSNTELFYINEWSSNQWFCFHLKSFAHDCTSPPKLTIATIMSLTSAPKQEIKKTETFTG